MVATVVTPRACCVLAPKTDANLPHVLIRAAP